MKENSDGNDTNVGSIGNSIEEDITKINTYVELVLKKDYCNCNELNTILGKHCDGSKNVAYAMQHILSDYKKVLKENEILKEEKEQAWEEWNNLEQGSYETEQKLKQQIKELKKENEELNNRCRNLDKEAQAYLEELAGDNTLTRRTIKQLQEENEELKNNTRKNENELEFDIDCDWIALQKMLDESEKSNEYISYKNEKWIKEKYCIPIQKIKDKIEELNKKVKDYQCVENRINLYQRKVLQELLEESEE